MSAAEVQPVPGRLRAPGPGPAARLLAGPVTVARTGHADQLAEATTVESLARHHERWGPRPHGGPWLFETASTARLTGCGGGHFPAATKWRAALARRRPVTLVANAAEGERLSAKDATLLRLRPHLVLDGLATLAEALHAEATVVWIHEDDTQTWRRVHEAVRERRLAGLGGPPVAIRTAAPHYLSGESSAVKHALLGGPTLPTFRDPGGSAPDAPHVVVHNVETLAHLARLSRDADGSPCRLLTVLTPHDRRVIEVPGRTHLAEAVQIATGRAPSSTAAVLLGGYGGTWARWCDVAGLEVEEAVVRRHGLTLGPGIVAPLWDASCGIAVTATIAGYLARASAGQCGPCLFGLPALADSLDRLVRGRARRRELDRLRGDLDAVDGRGACHHPDGAVRFVRSALSVFAEDVEAHAAGKPCGRSGDAIPIPDR